MKDKIFERLNLIVKNINEGNLFDNFPRFLDDLDYISRIFPIEFKKLSNKEKMKYGDKYYSLITDFYISLTKIFYKLEYNCDLKIEEIFDDSLSTVSAGYSYKTGVINFTSLGILIGLTNTSKVSGFFETFLHEARHKRQDDYMKENDMNKVLDYPSYMILIAKEILYDRSLRNNKSMFFLDNYSLFYYEEDAEYTALKILQTFLLNLYKRYILYCKDKNIKLPSNLLYKVEDIQNLFNEESKKVFNNRFKQGKLYKGILDELYGNRLITSDYNYEGKATSRLILIDQYIINHPEIQETYPVFKLIFNGNKKKTYQEIMNDKELLINRYQDKKDEIERLYFYIIKSDPLLLLDVYINNDNYYGVYELFMNYPDLINLYYDDIKLIRGNSINIRINELLDSYLVKRY